MLHEGADSRLEIVELSLSVKGETTFKFKRGHMVSTKAGSNC